MNRRTWMLALTIGALAACGGTPDEKAPEQTLTFNLTAEPEHLDPALITGLHDSTVAIQLFEGLVTVDPHTLAIRPGIATQWDKSADGLRYTFTLRESNWSNGSPLTAEDVVQSWKRVLDPQTGSQYADYLFFIKGAKSYHEGRSDDFSKVGVSAPDSRTVVVELNQITPFFLYLVAFHTYMPTKKSATDLGPTWVKPETMVCNGPFILKEHQPNHRIVLVPNPEYYDRDKVRLERVVIYTTDNLDTCVKMYMAGETMWVRDIPQGHIARLSQHKDYHATPLWGTMFVDLNTTRAPLDNIKVRTALSLAIDREKLVKFVTQAGEIPTANLVPPGFPGWTSPPARSLYDPDLARKLLAEAGFSGGTGFPQMNILVDNQDVHIRLVEALQAMWKENLGIDLGIVRREWAVYLSELRQLQYDVARARWYGDFYDPVTFVGIFTGGNGNNHTGYASGKFDHHIQLAGELLDPEKRLTQLEAAEQLLVRDDLPIAPLYHLVSRELVSPRIDNMPYNALSLRPLKEVYLKPETP